MSGNSRIPLAECLEILKDSHSEGCVSAQAESDLRAALRSSAPLPDGAERLVGEVLAAWEAVIARADELTFDQLCEAKALVYAEVWKRGGPALDQRAPLARAGGALRRRRVPASGDAPVVT